MIIYLYIILNILCLVLYCYTHSLGSMVISQIVLLLLFLLFKRLNLDTRDNKGVKD